MSLSIGYELATGAEVKVPVFFSLITGQTGYSGKTTLLRKLARQAAAQGYKILVVDSKTNALDYEGFGQDVPICLQESLDSFVLLNLIESIAKRKVTQWYSTLIRITEGAKDYDSIIERAQVLIAKSRDGFFKDALIGLKDFLKRLKVQTQAVKTVPDLQLPYPINRMAINEFLMEGEMDIQGQQLIVKTVFDQALRHYTKLIIILDEGSKFLPQRYSSVCAKSIQDYVTQGRATEDFMWLGCQFLATTDKAAMKTMAVKFLGTQDHDTECEHTLELIPYIAKRFTKDTIMRLKLGHFIVVTKDWVKTVYVCPEYADKQHCREVAQGLRAPKEVDFLISVQKQPLSEAKPLSEAEKIASVTKTVKEVQARIKAAPPNLFKPAIPPVRNHKPRYGTQIRDLKGVVDNLKTRVDALESTVHPNGDVCVKQPLTYMAVKNIPKKAEINGDTIRGKVLSLAKEGYLNNWHPLSHIFHTLEDTRRGVKRDRLKKELYVMVDEGYLASKLVRGNRNYAISPNIMFVNEGEKTNV